MLWTIVPMDVVMDDDDDGAASAVEIAEMSVGNVTVVLHVGADGARRVQRLLSTNPADYLRPEWQPGAMWRGAARGAGTSGERP